MNDLRGFTLAEVLVTLGIIGVVAALLHPMLVNKIQERILKQQYKKVYTTLSKALQKTYADNSMVWYECYYPIIRNSGTCIEYDEDTHECSKYENVVGLDKNSECQAYYEALKKVLSPVKVCENNAYRNGCIPDMKGYDTVISEQNPDKDDGDFISMTSGCSGYREADIKNNNPAWVLNDGTVIGFYNNILGKTIWIDINGHKKPNKWGYDIFTLQVEGDENKRYITSAGCMMPEKGGKSSHTMFKELYN